MYSQEFIKKTEERLKEEKARVETEIKRLERPEEPMDNPSPEDLAQDATEDIIEESLLKVHRVLLERIDEALGRVKDGTFGRCLECGAFIEENDLAAEPWLEYCEKCNKKKAGADAKTADH